MKKKTINMDELYKKTAEKFGETPEETEKHMSEAIRMAWDFPEDSDAKKLQLELFPDGRTPTNEEFILRMVEMFVDKKS